MTVPLRSGDPITVNVALGDRAYDIAIGRYQLLTQLNANPQNEPVRKGALAYRPMRPPLVEVRDVHTAHRERQRSVRRKAITQWLPTAISHDLDSI